MLAVTIAVAIASCTVAINLFDGHSESKVSLLRQFDLSRRRRRRGVPVHDAVVVLLDRPHYY